MAAAAACTIYIYVHAQRNVVKSTSTVASTQAIFAVVLAAGNPGLEPQFAVGLAAGNPEQWR